MPARHRPPRQSWPQDGLLKAGVPIFALGLVAVLLDVGPFFFGANDRPLWLNLVAVLALPVGLALALVGLLRSARTAPASVPTDDQGPPAPPSPAAVSPDQQPAATRGRHARVLAGSHR